MTSRPLDARAITDILDGAGPAFLKTISVEPLFMANLIQAKVLSRNESQTIMAITDHTRTCDALLGHLYTISPERFVDFCLVLCDKQDKQAFVLEHFGLGIEDLRAKQRQCSNSEALSTATIPPLAVLPPSSAAVPVPLLMCSSGASSLPPPPSPTPSPPQGEDILLRYPQVVEKAPPSQKELVTKDRSQSSYQTSQLETNFHSRHQDVSRVKVMPDDQIAIAQMPDQVSYDKQQHGTGVKHPSHPPSRSTVTERSSNPLALALALAIAGLDTAYWVDILKQADIDHDIETLTLHREEVFERVGRNARDEWESAMLRDFLGFEEDWDQRKGLARETWESRKNVLREMLVKQDSSYFPHPGPIEEGQTLITAGYLMKRASDGLALRGVLFTDNPYDCLTPRCQVLDVLPGAETCAPGHSEYTGSVDVYSPRMTDQFRQALCNIGYHAADTFSESGWGFFEKADLSSRKSGTHIEEKQCIAFTAIPSAACAVNEETTILSEAVNAELNKIRLAITRHKETQIMQDMCEGFLLRFGSHVNYGLVEFGKLDFQEEDSEPQSYSLPQVIERGSSYHQDFKPIWEVAFNEGRVDGAGKLRYMLKKAWRNMFSYPSASVLSEGEHEMSGYKDAYMGSG